MGLLNQELTEKVLGCAFSVHNALGPGFALSASMPALTWSHPGTRLLEAVYEEAFAVELSFRGIVFERQKRFPVYYRGKLVGDYYADLVVENAVLLELKAVRRFSESMEAQLLNYLAISGIEVGYLLNFHAPRVEWKLFVYSGQI